MSDDEPFATLLANEQITINGEWAERMFDNHCDKVDGLEADPAFMLGIMLGATMAIAQMVADGKLDHRYMEKSN